MHLEYQRYSTIPHIFPVRTVSCDKIMECISCYVDQLTLIHPHLLICPPHAEKRNNEATGGTNKQTNKQI